MHLGQKLSPGFIDERHPTKVDDNAPLLRDTRKSRPSFIRFLYPFVRELSLHLENRFSGFIQHSNAQHGFTYASSTAKNTLSGGTVTIRLWLSSSDGRNSSAFAAFSGRRAP